MNKKPTILVTRKLPDVVEERLLRDYDVPLNPHDDFYTKSNVIKFAQGAQGILPYQTEKFTAEVIEKLPNEVKIIANFSVDVDHVDLAAAKKKHVCHKHP